MDDVVEKVSERAAGRLRVYCTNVYKIPELQIPGFDEEEPTMVRRRIMLAQYNYVTAEAAQELINIFRSANPDDVINGTLNIEF